jgi:hypothetical protein
MTCRNDPRCLSYTEHTGRLYIPGISSYPLILTTLKIRQYDRHPELPLGPPQLMMSLTNDSIIEKHKSTLEDMDKKVGVSSQAKRELRAGYLPKENMDRPVAEGADSGLEQRLQFELKPQES